MAMRHLRRVQRARRRIQAAEEELLEAILAAHAAGESYADIGEWAELSRQRVHEMVKAYREKQSGLGGWC